MFAKSGVLSLTYVRASYEEDPKMAWYSVLTDTLDFLVGDHLAAARRPALVAHLSREVTRGFRQLVLRQRPGPRLHVHGQEEVEAFEARLEVLVRSLHCGEEID